MYVEDPDEDVEEEEEYHEVEEDKLKISQESVDTNAGSDRIPVSSSSQLLDEPQQVSSQEPLEYKGTPQDNSIADSEPDIKQVQVIEDEPSRSLSANDQINEIKSETVAPVKTDAVVERATEKCVTDVITPDSIQPDPPLDPDFTQCGDKSAKAAPVAESDELSPTTDWANIMLNSETKPSELDKTENHEAEHGDLVQNVESIIKQTQEINLNDDIIDQTSGDQINENEAAPLESVAGGTKEIIAVEEELSTDDQKGEDIGKKKLDLDEDEENPQYIPKKGDFYEHDDRSLKVGDNDIANKDNDETEAKDSNANKKSSNQEKQNDNRRSNRRQRIDADRWNHDLFRDEKQKPKNNTSHGYENRQQDRIVRNQVEARTQRSTIAADRPQGIHDNRSRQARDVRAPRQNQPVNRSREKKPRRNNIRNNNRGENSLMNPRIRDATIKDSRPKLEAKEPTDGKQSPLPHASFSAPKKDHDNRESRDNKNTRTDSRGRRRTSRDRPNNPEEKLPPPNTVMPPITTWSNEDMVKAEAFSKDSPSRSLASQANNYLNVNRGRTNELWSHGQPSKNFQHDRMRTNDENRHQSYVSRGRYQDRVDDVQRLNQFTPRNQFNERPNQNNQDWNRGANNNSSGKLNDYVVKTQTFENSRLSQANRSNYRDLRDVLNERRMQGQQHFQAKPPQGVDSTVHSRGQMQSSQYHQFGQQHIMHQSHLMPNHQASPHILQQQLQHQHTSLQLQPQISAPVPPPQQQLSIHQSQQNKQSSINLHQQSSQSQAQSSSQAQQHNIQSQRQQGGIQASQSKINPLVNNVIDNQESSRSNSGAINSSDPLNSRPIIKTDAYTGTTGIAHPPSHQSTSQHLSQHSQNNRGVSGSMAQQQQQQHGPSPPSSHMMPSHLSTSSVQSQYYTSSGARDSTSAAALASAYHGYIPGGHTVMDSARYHMTSQMSDHGYMTSPGQAGDVATGPVMHQQGMYADTAGETVASSAYMAQAGLTLSPSSTIPVTGSGGPQPLPPVSYLQHSQYPPPPYSNPYPQHQHGQAPPPHSGQAYPPYWTYI